MVRGELHDPRVGVERLDEHASRIAEASAAPGELRQQRERALLAAEVGELQPLVGVECRREPNAAHVVPLGHHLRADEHGAGLAREALEHVLERAARRRGVGVEAQHGDAGPARVDHGLDDPLGARAEPHDVDRPAGRAGARHVLGVAAVVAAEPPAGVQGQADVAVGAAEPASAGAAVQRRRGAAPVEQEDRPAALVGERAEAVAQRARERVVRVAPQVDHLDRRQRRRRPASAA